jgi:cation transport regulator ChaC
MHEHFDMIDAMKTRQALFGYGSLVNRASLEATLGRKVDGLSFAHVKGWQRDWSVAVGNLNSSERFELRPSGGVPDLVLALNLSPSTKEQLHWPNGVLVEVNESEIEQLDAREAHYNRVDITDDILGTHDYEKVFTYIGKSDYIPSSDKPAVVPASYLRLVLEGFASVGDEAAKHFHLTTTPTQAEVVETVFVGQG